MSARRRYRILVLFLLAVAVVVVSYRLLGSDRTVPEEYVDAGSPARIDPDYSGCFIPPNIAPLNFVVKEPGTQYRLKAYSKRGDGFVFSSRTGDIIIPLREWRTLLDLNRGNDLYFDIYTEDEQGRWRRFTTITNRIAHEDIDPYLVYRRLKPLHHSYMNMGTYQRNLSTYRESPVLVSRSSGTRCVNCHTFANNAPDPMIMHMRGPDGVAMILARNGTVARINTRTEFNSSPAAYTSWHPSGRLAAFSVNKLALYHHAVGDNRNVVDRDSELAIYLVDSNLVTSIPEISDPDHLETFPAWSPDGKYLYFCSTVKSWTTDLEEGDAHLANYDEEEGALLSDYDEVRYNLMRISYDITTGAWGELETVLLAKDTGLSITEPRISPDGRFLLFCMSEYGPFPVYQRSSDLYMIDLKNGQHWNLAINSDRSDSWHCWSSNSRWIAFASKRRDGLFARVYFSYIDADGKGCKPFLLPQKDPRFYDSLLDNFNVPELITAPISVEQEEFLRAIHSSEEHEATFMAGATPQDG